MGVISLCRLTLLYATIASYGLCLVCYDNVVAGEPVFIGCNFPGAACAVTNKTSTLRLGRTAFTENKLMYHCAHTTRSCIAGPLKHCANSTLQDVDCDTWCCTTDKCNVPAEQNITAQSVSEREALGCYQLVGTSEERVKCMFKDAQCLFMDIKSRFSFIDDGQKSASQLCVTKRHCEEMGKHCSDFNSISWSMKTCSSKCCNTDYCNPLPWDAYYNEKVSKNGNTARKDQPEWFKPVSTTTTQAPESVFSKAGGSDTSRKNLRYKNGLVATQTTSGSTSDPKVGSDYGTSAELSSGSRTALYAGISALALAVLVATIAYMIHRRRRRRKYRNHSYSPAVPGLNGAYGSSLT